MLILSCYLTSEVTKRLLEVSPSDGRLRRPCNLRPWTPQMVCHMETEGGLNTNQTRSHHRILHSLQRLEREAKTTSTLDDYLVSVENYMNRWVDGLLRDNNTSQQTPHVAIGIMRNGSDENSARIPLGVTEATEGQCAICHEEYTSGESAALLSCKHYFHGPCINEWLKRKTTCPLCRRQL